MDFLNHLPSEYLERTLEARKAVEKVNESVLVKILKFCLDKNLMFEVRPKLGLVSVNNEDSSFNIRSYYKGNLVDYQDGDTLTFNNFFTEIKKYK